MRTEGTLSRNELMKIPPRNRHLKIKLKRFE